MIRVVSITALLWLLVLELYQPSAHPPERFLAQIRTEHQAMEQLWGEAPTLRWSMVDGAISRVIKSKEFVHHDPERFALYASLAILLTCGGVVAMAVPASLHPMVTPAGLSALAMLSGRSIAHFHRRG